jgi:hypothetical protein
MELSQETTNRAADFELAMEDDSIAQKSSTLFPKITGNLKDLVKNYHYHLLRTATTPEDILSISKVATKIPLVGTVKLHGTHADLVIHSNGDVFIQSRNREQLTAELDNYDTYKTLIPLRPEILRLRDRYHKRFYELNPGMHVLDTFPTIIGGEYIGPGIQKGVTLARFEKRAFVILSVSINDAWLPDIPYQRYPR